MSLPGFRSSERRDPRGVVRSVAEERMWIRQRAAAAVEALDPASEYCIEFARSLAKAARRRKVAPNIGGWRGHGWVILKPSGVQRPAEYARTNLYTPADVGSHSNGIALGFDRILHQYDPEDLRGEMGFGIYSPPELSDFVRFSDRMEQLVGGLGEFAAQHGLPAPPEFS
jgi:hypothetical protein